MELRVAVAVCCVALTATSARGTEFRDADEFSSCEVVANLKLDHECENIGECGTSIPVLDRNIYLLEGSLQCNRPDGSSRNLFLTKTLRRVPIRSPCNTVYFQSGRDHYGPSGTAKPYHATTYLRDQEIWSWLSRYPGAMYPMGAGWLEIVDTTTSPLAVMSFGGLYGSLNGSAGTPVTNPSDGCITSYSSLDLTGTLTNVPTSEVASLVTDAVATGEETEDSVLKDAFDLMGNAGMLPPNPIPDIIAGLPLPLPVYLVTVDYRTPSGITLQSKMNGVVGLPTTVAVPNKNTGRVDALTITVEVDLTRTAYSLAIAHDATSCLNADVTVSFSQGGTNSALSIGYDALANTASGDVEVAAPTNFNMSYRTGSTQRLDIVSSAYCDRSYELKAKGGAATLVTKMYGDDSRHLTQSRGANGANYFTVSTLKGIQYLKVDLSEQDKTSTYTLSTPATFMTLCTAGGSGCNIPSRAGVQADSSLAFNANAATAVTAVLRDGNKITTADITATTLNYDKYFDISLDAVNKYSGSGFDGNFFLDTAGNPVSGSYSGNGFSLSAPAPGLTTSSRNVILRKEEHCALGLDNGYCTYEPVIDTSGAITCPSGYYMIADDIPSWVEDWIRGVFCG